MENTEEGTNLQRQWCYSPVLTGQLSFHSHTTEMNVSCQNGTQLH